MNMIFDQNFVDSFKKMDYVDRVSGVQGLGYFCVNPTQAVFVNQPIYVATISANGTYLINIAHKYKAVYHLVDDKTALFTHILAGPANPKVYEQPVVLPQEVQT